MKKLLAAAMLLLASVSSFAQFSPGQLVTAAALNNQFSLYVPIAGGTLTGPLTVPTLTTAYAAITGGTITGTPISGSTGAFTTVNTSGLATLGSASVAGTLGVTGATTLNATNLNGVVTGVMPPPPWATYSTAYNPMWVNVNGFPASAMNGNNTHAITSAFTGSIDTPASDNTLWNGNVSFNAGLSGYARSASPNKGSVGVYGVGMSNANNTQQWGGNFICTNFDAASGNDPGQTAFYCVGAEADVYLNGTGLTGTAVGFKIAAAMASIPSGGAYGIEIAPANVAGTLGWSAAFTADDAPNTAAFAAGAAGIGNNVASQPVQFKSRNSSGTVALSRIYADANGNITLAPAASTAILSGLSVGVNGTTAGTVSLANGTPGGASVTLANAATGTPWTLYLPPGPGAAGTVWTSNGPGASGSWTSPNQLPVTTVSSLPTCGSGQKGLMYAVSDATSPTYNGSLTGGGSSFVSALCNGSSWTAH